VVFLGEGLMGDFTFEKSGIFLALNIFSAELSVFSLVDS
jgi:hypothetical protein